MSAAVELTDPEYPIHTISLFVNNVPGVLVRVSLVFSRRGFNIESMVVSPGAEACPPKDTGLGAKCIGREAVDSGCHVVAVNRFDGLGRVEQRLGRPQGQAAVESTPFQFRAGCPVEEEQSPLQVVG